MLTFSAHIKTRKRNQGKCRRTRERGLKVLIVAVLGDVGAARLALALARAQLVRQQELAPVKLVQQQHLYALRALPLCAKVDGCQADSDEVRLCVSILWARKPLLPILCSKVEADNLPIISWAVEYLSVRKHA